MKRKQLLVGIFWDDGFEVVEEVTKDNAEIIAKLLLLTADNILKDHTASSLKAFLHDGTQQQDAAEDELKELMVAFSTLRGEERKQALKDVVGVLRAIREGR